jgi:hypothetical protein
MKTLTILGTVIGFMLICYVNTDNTYEDNHKWIRHYQPNGEYIDVHSDECGCFSHLEV